MMTETIIASNDLVLEPVLATPDALEGYGYLIGEPDGLLREKMDFYPEVRVTQPAKFEANDDVCLNLVTFQQRELEVRWMEFHNKHTQTFIPLSGKPFYMVLGKPTAYNEKGKKLPGNDFLPNAEDVRAFFFDGSAGIVMQVGTWHEVPFPVDGETHFVCICTNETNDDLESEGEDGERDGGDLAKRSIEKRLGRRIVIKPHG